MRKLTFTNSRGDHISIGHSSPFHMSNIEGLGAVETDTQMQKAPFQDGMTYTDSSLSYREIFVEGAIKEMNKKRIMDKRRLLHQVLNTKLKEGVILYEQDGVAKEIHAVVEGGVIFPDKKQDAYQRFFITFNCASPYWMDLETKSEPLEAWVGKYSFPFQFPVEMGIQGDTTNIMNDGDVKCPIEIEIKGYTKNPFVQNKTTGEFIKVNREVALGETLVISTTFGNKRVEIVRSDGKKENAFHWIDLNSKFFHFITGENQISYSSDEGRSVVMVSWRNLYVGV
ncbi:phage tail family protein [Chengkuizengella marina]|nr:phage tail family protein [Chengkuizengella marina]